MKIKNLLYKISFVMIMSMLISCVPVNAYASEQDEITVQYVTDVEIKEMLVDKAIKAFPEFEDKIRGENVEEIARALKRRTGVGEVVYTETRSISETETVTYTELDNGIALTALGLMTGKNVTNTFSNGPTTIYTMNVWLQCGSSLDVLFVSGFQYKISYTGYDAIVDLGNLNNVSNTADSAFLDSYKLNEDSNANAYAAGNAYAIWGSYFNFNINYGEDDQFPVSQFGNLEVIVGDNTLEINCY